MFDIIMAIPWLPIAIGASSALGLGTSVAQMIQGGNQASNNLQFQRENLEYQKGLQNQIFEREDNAVQRRAKDLESAGLSKTLAAGNPAQAGSVIKTDALQDTKADKQAQGLQQMAQLGNLAQMYANIDSLTAQKINSESSAYLNSQKARIVKHDADYWDGTNIPSNTSGLAKALSDAISMIRGTKMPKPSEKIIRDVSDIVKTNKTRFKPKTKLKEVQPPMWKQILMPRSRFE